MLIFRKIIIAANYIDPDDSDSKESDCNMGELGSVPGSERSPGEENDYPLQYCYLENSKKR